jgi:hypothetical protein
MTRVVTLPMLAALLPAAFLVRDPAGRGCDAPATPATVAPPTVSQPAWAPAAVADRDSAVVAAFAAARSFPEFLEASTQRLPEWYATAERVQLADSSLQRARAVGGRWRLLVVAVDTCGDSLRQLPYVARLAELVHGLSMRVITPADGGAAVQAAYRALDGRRATPTYVLLDPAGRVAGCVVELPRPLRHFLHERREVGTRETSPVLADSALAWYREDAGASIVHEMVTLLEGGRAETPVCERGEAP